MAVRVRMQWGLRGVHANLCVKNCRRKVKQQQQLLGWRTWWASWRGSNRRWRSWDPSLLRLCCCRLLILWLRFNFLFLLLLLRLHMELQLLATPFLPRYFSIFCPQKFWFHMFCPPFWSHHSVLPSVTNSVLSSFTFVHTHEGLCLSRSVSEVLLLTNVWIAEASRIFQVLFSALLDGLDRVLLLIQWLCGFDMLEISSCGAVQTAGSVINGSLLGPSLQPSPLQAPKLPPPPPPPPPSPTVAVHLLPPRPSPSAISPSSGPLPPPPQLGSHKPWLNNSTSVSPSSPALTSGPVTQYSYAAAPTSSYTPAPPPPPQISSGPTSVSSASHFPVPFHLQQQQQQYQAPPQQYSQQAQASYQQQQPQPQPQQSNAAVSTSQYPYPTVYQQSATTEVHALPQQQQVYTLLSFFFCLSFKVSLGGSDCTSGGTLKEALYVNIKGQMLNLLTIKFRRKLAAWTLSHRVDSRSIVCNPVEGVGGALPWRELSLWVSSLIWKYEWTW